MTSVITPQESGRRGYVAMLAKYGERKVNQWRRMGGRKRYLTHDELLAAEAATRRERRLSSKSGGAHRP